jgi:isopenicillin N synthase-like dioxygenase
MTLGTEITSRTDVVLPPMETLPQSTVISPLPQTSQIDSIAPASEDFLRGVLHGVAPKVTALHLASASIPLFDFEEIAKATGKERANFIRAFGDGLRDVGFIAIKAERCSCLIDAVFKETINFFKQPLEIKMRYWREDNISGFSQMGRETAAGYPKADLKEYVHIPSNCTDWPQDLENFKITMQTYHHELTAYMRQAMLFLNEYLQEPSEDVDKSMDSPLNIVRLAWYPAPQPNDDKEAMWAAPHEDLNALTLLPPATAPGLQLMDKNGEWKEVSVPKGYLIVNTGEQVEKKTGGLIKATRHRVLNPGGEWATIERHSAVYFGSWSANYSLKAYSSCLEKMCVHLTPEKKAGYIKKYSLDVNVLDNLNARLIEMETIKNPPKDLVQKLRDIGLIQIPPESLKRLYPSLFETRV